MTLKDKEVVVALSSIPNTGKTTLFNLLTGSSQSTGNWPGVSIEKKIGHFNLGEYQIQLVDFPGTYALSPLSHEERVVRNFFLKTPPDVVLNILDGRNLYRGLGLTLQMAMSGLPMAVVINMLDEVRQQGIELDIPALAAHLGLPVVAISARTGEGLPEFQHVLYQIIKNPERTRLPLISFPPVLEEAIKSIARKIDRSNKIQSLDHNFMALQLLEEEKASDAIQDQAVVRAVKSWRQRVESVTSTKIPITCATCRFNAARGLVLEATHQRPIPPDARSEKIDRILLHRWFGLPLFMLIMLLLFEAIYGLGVPLQETLAHAFNTGEVWLLAQQYITVLPAWLQSFLFDGLWQGIGVVFSFFPIIALFFIFMTLIEDSGYMARAAFLMDSLMHQLGLDGKAFINLLLGYGCNIPAVMGTRILSSHYNRVSTMLLIPFTLCSARLQVFVFLTAILFPPAIAPWVLFALYIGSFIAVFSMGLLLKSLRIIGKSEPFIMEIPPYRIPTLNSVTLRIWQELKDFLYQAATLIIAGVMLVWLLTHFPTDVPFASAETWAGQLGQLLSPLFSLLGIHWQETVALLFGFIAKEIVIGALAVIYGGADLNIQVAAHITPLEGLSFMLFTLLYTPCIATLAAIRAESRSWRITLFSLVLGLGSAWIASFVLYQTGLVMGFK
ncbi:MAG: ferrous iron transport protein B [Methylococcaceae bacterium]|nr:ferrous iron transport protein B [Methylococcaceae bacterium]